MPTPAQGSTGNDTSAQGLATETGRAAVAPPALRVVLSRPTHPGNIGATARAMKAMGLHDLALVAPKPGIFPSEEALARAVAAEDILHRCQVCATLEEAVADAQWVVGTTARERHIGPPVMAPRAWAQEGRQRGGALALVFGQERTGLTNDEVARCQALIRIPTDPGFSSLNLAMAVQILCYEWHLADAAPVGEAPAQGSAAPPATHADLEGLYAHLRQVGDRVGFFVRKNPDAVHRRLRALFGRAGLDRNEINILRGFLREVQTQLPAESTQGRPDEPIE